MNGPDHYHVAERLIEELRNTDSGSPRETALIAEAQVHATLALAAAAARITNLAEWDRVLEGRSS